MFKHLLKIKTKLSNVATSFDKYKKDIRWLDIASWGKELGVSNWGKDIANMKSIHPNLFMGSRLSAQEVIDKGSFVDQNKKIYKAGKFYCICVASDYTCEYCEMSKSYKSFDMNDRHDMEENWLDVAKKTAKKINSLLLSGKYVLVHCHSGRNRSALAILVYCAMYTNLSYSDAIHEIKSQNSHRFAVQSTLQNTTFTTKVREEWDNLSFLIKFPPKTYCSIS